MKLNFCLMGLLCLYFSASAQINIAPSPLKIGDKMPDLSVTNIINSRYKSAHISDFKGKLIIIDFWATTCPSCIHGFPVLDSLQRHYSNKIQVLLVNSKKQHDVLKSVQMVIDRVNDWSTRRFKLPIVMQDTVITRYFPFQSVPTCVWIGPNGDVLAVTEEQQVTGENIGKVINGEKITLPTKSDYAFLVKQSKP